MKIIKIGTYDSAGVPMGWHIDCEFEGEAVNNEGSNKYCLGIDRFFPGSVDVNGVEITEWTLARKTAMGLF